MPPPVEDGAGLDTEQQKKSRCSNLVQHLQEAQPAVGPECAKCGLRGNVEAMSNKWDLKIGSTSKATSHILCNRSYGGLSRRWAKDSALLVWWNAKGDEDKKEWYMKHMSVERCKGEGFDLMINIVEEQKQVSGQEARLGDEYITYRQWALQEKTMDPKLEKPALEAKWLDLITKSSTPKIFERGQWLLGQFAGLRKETIDGSYTSVSQAKATRCANVEALRKARTKGDDLVEEAKRRRLDSTVAMPGPPTRVAQTAGVAVNDVTTKVMQINCSDGLWDGELWQQDEDARMAAEVANRT